MRVPPQFFGGSRTPAETGAFIDPVAQYAYTGKLVPELAGMDVLSDLVLGRVSCFDPLSGIGGDPATLRELGFSYNGMDAIVAALGLGPYSGRVDLRLGMDIAGDLYLLGKGSGDVFHLASADGAPEPAGWAMLASGLGLIGATLRRRRRMTTAPLSG